MSVQREWEWEWEYSVFVSYARRQGFDEGQDPRKSNYCNYLSEFDATEEYLYLSWCLRIDGTGLDGCRTALYICKGKEESQFMGTFWEWVMNFSSWTSLPFLEIKTRKIR